MYARPITRRDVFLVLFGACSMYIWSFIFNRPREHSLLLGAPIDLNINEPEPNVSTPNAPTTVSTTAPPERDRDPLIGPSAPMTSLPHTSILAHAPGWTLFKNLYMANGTLLIVSPSNDSFPPIRMMTSPGYPAEATPEDMALREPKAEHMDFLTPEQAEKRWKASGTESTTYRVWSIKGNTILFNDPRQFLRHYYHFVAELILGTWVFWHGAFTKPSSDNSLSLSYSGASYPPPIHRVIFAHSDSDGWHDDPAFDAYFFRAALPYVTVEEQRAWEDRIVTTVPRSSDLATNRAWHFPLVLLTDRSASFRGPICGRTQRTAAEAWEYMLTKNQLIGAHAARWWDPLRETVWRFAGVNTPDAVNWMKQSFDREGLATKSDKEVTPSLVREGAFQELLPVPQKIVITYISRQLGPRRKLLDDAHDDLLLAISELVTRRKVKGEEWEFRHVNAQRLSKDEQIRMAADSTIMLGVHGNGLTHLVFMPPTRFSTVIEIFYPKGFAHDYEWTATAMGMKYFGVWNDTHFTLPNEPTVNYPPGFQENSIPVHGPSVAKLIEDRVDGRI
ncbi:Protein of unknown function (DUF563) domain containing protein [Amanita muscaria]